MNIGVISNRYAKALYQYAAEGQCEKQVYREMMTLADSYLQVPALRKALDNPLLSVAEKTDLLCNACGGKVSPQTKRFFMLVLTEHREKFMQNLGELKPKAQEQWASLPTDFPDKVPVHLNPNGQISGRFSTHAPNLQGLPKVLRPAFYVEPHRLCHLVAGDYRQIQPRILAALSGDSEWNRPFAEGIDFYKHCASAMFGKSYEDITDDERAVSKSISMGIVFGMGVDKMLETLEERDITSIDRAHAEALRKAFLDRFPTLMTWRDSLSTSKYAGKIEGDTAHRTLRLPSGRQIVYDAAGFGQQPLCSHLAQGIEAEIVLNAILKFRKASAEQAISARIALVIHDELLIACRGTDTDAQAAGDLLKTCMEEAFWEYPGMPHAEGIVKVSTPSVYWGASD